MLLAGMADERSHQRMQETLIAAGDMAPSEQTPDLEDQPPFHVLQDRRIWMQKGCSVHRVCRCCDGRAPVSHEFFLL